MHRLTIIMAAIVAALLPIAALAQEDAGTDNEIAEIDRRLDRGINFENWEGIVAFLVPLLISVIVQSHWSRKLQAVAAFTVALIVTLIGQMLKGDFAVDDWLGSTLKVFPAAIAFYYGLWRPTGIADAIKDATTFSRGGTPPA